MAREHNPSNLDNITPFVVTLDYNPHDDDERTLKTFFDYVLTPEEAIARAARMLITQKLGSCAVYVRKEGNRIADLQADWRAETVECERWDNRDGITDCMQCRMLDDKLVRIAPVFQNWD